MGTELEMYDKALKDPQNQTQPVSKKQRLGADLKDYDDGSEGTAPSVYIIYFYY